jgi:LPXTG-site transpeptidase (sortase) family protein
LLVLIILVNLYTLVLPYVPGWYYWFNRHGDTSQTLQRKIHTKPTPSSPTASNNDENRLTIPAIALDQPIRESNYILNSGIWHITRTSTPGHGSNTVIIGHRFTYTNPFGTFYNLDKLKINDEIGITWQHKKYIYVIRESKVVPPTETSIEAPTTTDKLTLYTCTPLHIPKNRLVVVAGLKETLQ